MVMNDVRSREGQPAVMRWAHACMTLLVGASLVLAGCVTGGGQPEPPAEQGEGQAAAATSGTATDAADALPAGSGTASVAGDGWLSADCLDRAGDITVYAVSQLKGWQLELLLEEQHYEWGARNQLWLNDKGTVGLSVLDAQGEAISNDEVAELGVGAALGKASYRIVTSSYASVQGALNALVAPGLTIVDSELTATSGVAVVRDAHDRVSLVLLHDENDAIVISFVSRRALRKGLLDTLAGRELGTTVGEVFERLAGREVQEPPVS
jgi:hypothetical protein